MTSRWNLGYSKIPSTAKCILNNVSTIKHLVSLNFTSPQLFALNLGKVMEVLTYCFALFFTHSGSGKVIFIKDFPGGASGKEPTCQCRRHRRQVLSLDQEDCLEEGMATHSNVLAWRIPWTEEPGGLQSMGSQRVEHDWSELAGTKVLIEKIVSWLDSSKSQFNYKLRSSLATCLHFRSFLFSHFVFSTTQRSHLMDYFYVIEDSHVWPPRTLPLRHWDLGRSCLCIPSFSFLIRIKIITGMPSLVRSPGGQRRSFRYRSNCGNVECLPVFSSTQLWNWGEVLVAER